MDVLGFWGAKTRSFFTHLLVALAIVGSIFSSAVIADAADTASLIVKLVDGLSAEQQAAVIARDGGVEASSIPALRLHTITVETVDLPLVQENYQTDPQVLSVELNKTRNAEGVPTDREYGVQWALSKIGWENVFGTVTPTGAARIALLDTGVDATHPDLTGSVIPGTSILVSGSNGCTDPNGHGTSLAGILAAVTNNDLGIAGVGYQGVSIMPVTVLNASGIGQDSDIIAGILWAADHGADVILMAFSNPDYSQNLQDAIDYAWSKGAVLVSATGNNGVSTATFPAGARGVVGVSATNSADLLDPGSNYGLATFLAAPGRDIFTTDPGGNYTYFSGTSASSAMVAGVAGFMKAVDPGLTNGVIVGRLARSADAIGTPGDTNNPAYFGNGRLNMASALADTGTDPVQPSGAAPVGSGGPYVGPYTAAAKILSIVFAGAGSGTITLSDTSPTSLNGSISANSNIRMNSATLTVTAGPDSTFAGWSGSIPQKGTGPACTGSTSPCTVDINADGTLTAIFKANQTITLTAADLITIYTGSQKAVSYSTSPATFTGVTVTYTGIEPAAYPETETPPSKAGSYTVVAHLTNDNYHAADATGTLTIAPKQIEGSFTVGNKVYDGTNLANIESRTLAGVISGDAVSLDGGSATFDSKNVGTAKTVTATGLLLSGLDAGNYTVNTTATAQADITAKHINGSFTADNKVYDGATSATVLTRSLDGTIAGDIVSLNGGTADFADKNLGNGKLVTLTGATLIGADAGNYLLDSVTTATANITAKALTVAGLSALDKPYDGNTSATITGTAALSGVVSGDAVTLSGTPSGAFSDSAVGNGKIVAISGLSLSGAQAGNYSLVEPTVTANITPAALICGPGFVVPETNSTGSFSVSWDSCNVAGVTYILEKSVNSGNFTPIYSGSSTSATINVWSSGSYSFRVKAVKSGYADSPYTGPKTCIVTLVCGAPYSITVPATNSTGSFSVSWGYGTTSGGSYVLEKSTDGVNFSQAYSGYGTSITLAALSNGSYTFRVKTIKSGFTDSPYTGPKTCIVTLACGAPGYLTVPATNSTGSFSVSWEYSNTSGATYVLEKSTDGVNFVQAYSGSSTGTTIAAPLNGSYTFRVKAIKSGYADSPYTGPKTCSVVLSCEVPSYLWVPSTSSSSLVFLYWGSSNTSGVTYVLEKSVDGVNYSQIYSGSGASWYVAGLVNGSYSFRIKAIKSGYADSAYTTTNSCSVIIGCSAPDMLLVPATSSTGSMYVRWSGSFPTGASYILEQSVNGGSYVQVYSGSSTNTYITASLNGSYSFRVKATMSGSAYADSSYTIAQNSCQVTLN